MAQFTENEAARFWAKVDKSAGCWNWIASVRSTGYGQFYFRGRPRPTHQLAYADAHGDLPAGLHVLHRCDNRLCVNPDHLWVGTNAHNVADRERKGRNNPRPAQDEARRKRLARTACKYGHTYEPGTYVLIHNPRRPGPSRRCLLCRRERGN